MTGKFLFRATLAAAICFQATEAFAQSDIRSPTGGTPNTPSGQTGAAEANNPAATGETKAGKGIIDRSGNSTSVSDRDRAFIQQAARYATTEIQSGRLALGISQSPKVKMYAEQTVNTGENTLAPLKKLAGSLGIPLANEDSMAKAEADQLRAARGTVFDGLYGQLQSRDQQALADLYGEEAKNGTNSQLKSFAGVENQHAHVLLQNAKLLAQGTVSHTNPNCEPNGPAKAGCP